ADLQQRAEGVLRARDSTGVLPPDSAVIAKADTLPPLLPGDTTLTAADSTILPRTDSILVAADLSSMRINPDLTIVTDSTHQIPAPVVQLETGNEKADTSNTNRYFEAYRNVRIF